MSETVTVTRAKKVPKELDSEMFKNPYVIAGFAIAIVALAIWLVKKNKPATKDVVSEILHPENAMHIMPGRNGSNGGGLKLENL